MKRCPHCDLTYSDDTYNFCLEDGHRLLPTIGGEVTLVLPNTPGNFDSTLQDHALFNGPAKTRAQLQFEYWSALTGRLRDGGDVVKLGPAKAHFGMSARFANHPKVRIFASISLSKNIICSGIRTLNERELYEHLAKRRREIEREIDRAVLHPALDFHWSAEKKLQTVGEFTVRFPAPAIHDVNSWDLYLTWHRRILEALHTDFYKRVRNYSRSSIPGRSAGRPSETRQPILETV